MKDEPRFGDPEELQRDSDEPPPFRPSLIRAVALLLAVLLLMKCAL